MLQKISVFLIYHPSIDGYPYITMLIVNLVIRHGEKSVALLGIYFLDATPDGVYHIEIHHSSTETLVAVVLLRSFVLKDILYRTGDKCATVLVVQLSRAFHEDDSLP